MIDSIVVLHKAIEFSVDSGTLSAIENVINPEKSFLTGLLQDFVKNVLPVLAGAGSSYLAFYFFNKQKKSEMYFKSLEIEISTHKEFRRDLLLVDLKLSIDFPPSVNSWDDLLPAYVNMFVNKKGLFQKLKSKWIGLIDGEIVERIDNLLRVIGNAEKESADLESKFPAPTIEQSVAIDEYVGLLYADKLFSSVEEVNNQTKLVIERIRNSML